MILSPTPAILLVEHEDGIRDDLTGIFREELTGTHIDGIGDTSKIADYLRAARDHDLGYLAVVLQLNTVMSPQDAPGNVPAPLRQVFDAQTWGLADVPVLFFYSANLDAPLVQDFLRRAMDAMATTVELRRARFFCAALVLHGTSSSSKSSRNSSFPAGSRPSSRPSAPFCPAASPDPPGVRLQRRGTCLICRPWTRVAKFMT